MSPQTSAEWQAQIDGLALLKRLMPKTWPNTLFAFEVGDRASVAGTGGAR